MDNPVSSIRSNCLEVLFKWQLLHALAIKKIICKLNNLNNNYCKGAHSQHKHKEKNNCDKAFSQQKRTPSQIFLRDFLHFKNICFNKTFASDQFKTKMGSYNTNSFLSSFLLLKYLYVYGKPNVARFNKEKKSNIQGKFFK